MEVIVIEQNDNYYTDLIKHQKFDFGLKPIKIGLSNPDMLFSREDLYD